LRHGKGLYGQALVWQQLRPVVQRSAERVFLSLPFCSSAIGAIPLGYATVWVGRSGWGAVPLSMLTLQAVAVWMAQQLRVHRARLNISVLRVPV